MIIGCVSGHFPRARGVLLRFGTYSAVSPVAVVVCAFAAPHTTGGGLIGVTIGLHEPARAVTTTSLTLTA